MTQSSSLLSMFILSLYLIYIQIEFKQIDQQLSVTSSVVFRGQGMLLIGHWLVILIQGCNYRHRYVHFFACSFHRKLISRHASRRNRYY